MAPNFFSKFTRNPSGHSRDRSDSSSGTRSPSPIPGTTSSQRPRAFSSTFSVGNSAASSISTSPPTSVFGKLSVQPHSRVPSIKADTLHGHDNASDSSSLVNPNFTIVPPSPRTNVLGLEVDGLPDGQDEHRSVIEGLPASASASSLNGNFSGQRSRTTSSPASSAAQPSSSKFKLTKSRPTTPSSSTHSLPEAFAITSVLDSPIPPVPSLPAETQPLKQEKENRQATAGDLLPSPELAVRKMNSNKSLNGNSNVATNGANPPLLSRAGNASAPPSLVRTGNASSPHFHHEVDDMTPIVESPTSEYPSPPDQVSSGNPVLKSQPMTSGLLSSPRRDSDAASIRSTNTNASPPNMSSSKKKETSKPWRRQPTSKPTGLASAIAASGLAMANPAFSAQQQLQFSPPALPAVTRTGTSASNRKSSIGDSAPYMHPSSTSGGASSSTQFSPPRSSKSRRSSIGSGSIGGKRRRHRPSLSMHSDNGANASADNKSEYIPDPVNLDYYSGLESDDDNDSSMDSSDDDDLVSAIDVHDMPVTGFAVASSRRNADFHELFRNIPEGDYLIEDYGCALQREILIQGRLYISENHICFHANILGWITDLSIPIDEIISLEKKMTAFVIPNAILITTRQSKYTFASFLSRDTTYDVIYNIWRLVRPEILSGTLSDNASIGSGSREGGGIIEGTIIGEIDGSTLSPGAITGTGPSGGLTPNKVTSCKCGKEGKHFSEMAMDTIIPGTPDKIHNLIFTSGFIKDFLVTNQKLIDLQMSDWTAGDDNHLSRTMSYIKPLTGSVGPKQTKCEIRDEVEYCDFSPSNPSAYSSTLTTTRTPDVPSGGAFSIKTRTCITYASAISSKVVVTTQVEWTGRSFIKGLIERGAIDGQKTYHNDLDKAMRVYIQEHQTEFVPEGVKLDVVVAPPTTTASPNGTATTADTNVNITSATSADGTPSSRGLQWAWETIEGTWGVAKQSTKGALELLGDMLPPKSTLSSTSVLYLIIFALVVSNIWTWMRVPKAGTILYHPVAAKPTEKMTKAERQMLIEGEEREIMLKVEREDRERWIHGVVTALWDEMAAGKVPTQQSQQPQQPQQPMRKTMNPIPPQTFDEALSDVSALYKTLDQVEEKVKVIRESLQALQSPLETTATRNDGKGVGKEKMNDVD
ncbi:hypothetical protein J3R30DRAFT_3803639 [Lentinula aciculospora]|uniref:VASt domain-containing protein n=1 Tax=Lentinula aciculospora TaxID=153920 RepID=A0A9W9DHI9_9AGAR|nr:hypothetical protein J3R30DRAFT_3803639 [Lentinula aciculospora]